MKRIKKMFMLTLTVGLLSMSIAFPAAAAEVLNDQYTYSVTDQTGKVTETFTYDFFGEIYENQETEFNLVKDNAVLTFTPKTDMGAFVVGYNEVDGMLEANSIPWNIDGSDELVDIVTANTAASIAFKYGMKYYELVLYNETSEEESSIYFKIESDSADQPDAWAKAEVDEAKAAGLVPSELQNNYKGKITRADFAKLIIELLKVQSGVSIDVIVALGEYDLTNNPFTDTTLKEVILANQLGIVNGKGNGLFDPNGSITRQEAAIMLMNAASVLEADVSADAAAFSDNSSIAAWATAGVEFVSTYGIMNGTGSNTFTPKGTYTRQQAFTTILRLNDMLNEMNSITE